MRPDRAEVARRRPFVVARPQFVGRAGHEHGRGLGRRHRPRRQVGGAEAVGVEFVQQPLLHGVGIEVEVNAGTHRLIEQVQRHVDALVERAHAAGEPWVELVGTKALGGEDAVDAERASITVNTREHLAGGACGGAHLVPLRRRRVPPAGDAGLHEPCAADRPQHAQFHGAQDEYALVGDDSVDAARLPFEERHDPRRPPGGADAFQDRFGFGAGPQPPDLRGAAVQTVGGVGGDDDAGTFIESGSTGAQRSTVCGDDLLRCRRQPGGSEDRAAQGLVLERLVGG